jgi:hypothetical protein
MGLTRSFRSGSIAAQKLLFGHSDNGDLLPFLSGHFDTTTGHKQEASSYIEIHKIISQDVPGVADDRSKVLFLSDIVKGTLSVSAGGCLSAFREHDVHFTLQRSKQPIILAYPSYLSSVRATGRWILRLGRSIVSSRTSRTLCLGENPNESVAPDLGGTPSWSSQSNGHVEHRGDRTRKLGQSKSHNHGLREERRCGCML